MSSVELLFVRRRTGSQAMVLIMLIVYKCVLILLFNCISCANLTENADVSFDDRMFFLFLLSFVSYKQKYFTCRSPFHYLEEMFYQQTLKNI